MNSRVYKAYLVFIIHVEAVHASQPRIQEEPFVISSQLQ